VRIFNQESIFALPKNKETPLKLDYFDLLAVDMTWSKDKIIICLMQQLNSLGFLLLTNIPDYNE
jgi:hypothetical protein